MFPSEIISNEIVKYQIMEKGQRGANPELESLKI
jgi:hypothetical protein